MLIGLSACNESKAPPAADSGRVAGQNQASTGAKDRPIGQPDANPAATDIQPDHEPMKARPQAPLKPQPVYRPDDLRPARDDAKLAEAGIHLDQSKRLKLYTDVDPEFARTVPPLIDQVYDAWEDYFGPLPADRAGTDFQMSGYLMRDMAAVPRIWLGSRRAVYRARTPSAK